MLAVTVCGALDPELELGTLLVFDDLHFLVNRLPDGSICTLHTEPGKAGRGHWIYEEPFSEPLRQALLAGAREAGHAVRDGGCYGHVDGPRFNTKTEIRMLRECGVTCVSQTAGPETVLCGEAELPYALIGYATDYANGVGDEATPVRELIRLINASPESFAEVLAAAIPQDRRRAGSGGNAISASTEVVVARAAGGQAGRCAARPARARAARRGARAAGPAHRGGRRGVRPRASRRAHRGPRRAARGSRRPDPPRRPRRPAAQRAPPRARRSQDLAAGAVLAFAPGMDGKPFLLALPGSDSLGLLDDGIAGLAGAFAAAGGEVGMVRPERRLATADDARAYAVDPMTPDELRSLLTVFR